MVDSSPVCHVANLLIMTPDHDQVACLCLGDIISEDQGSQLQKQRCVGSID